MADYFSLLEAFIDGTSSQKPPPASTIQHVPQWDASALSGYDYNSALPSSRHSDSDPTSFSDPHPLDAKFATTSLMPIPGPASEGPSQATSSTAPHAPLVSQTKSRVASPTCSSQSSNSSVNPVSGDGPNTSSASRHPTPQSFSIPSASEYSNLPISQSTTPSSLSGALIVPRNYRPFEPKPQYTSSPTNPPQGNTPSASPETLQRLQPSHARNLSAGDRDAITELRRMSLQDSQGFVEFRSPSSTSPSRQQQTRNQQQQNMHRGVNRQHPGATSQPTMAPGSRDSTSHYSPTPQLPPGRTVSPSQLRGPGLEGLVSGQPRRMVAVVGASTPRSSFPSDFSEYLSYLEQISQDAIIPMSYPGTFPAPTIPTTGARDQSQIQHQQQRLNSPFINPHDTLHAQPNPTNYPPQNFPYDPRTVGPSHLSATALGVGSPADVWDYAESSPLGGGASDVYSRLAGQDVLDEDVYSAAHTSGRFAGSSSLPTSFQRPTFPSSDAHFSSHPNHEGHARDAFNYGHQPPASVPNTLDMVYAAPLSQSYPFLSVPPASYGPSTQLPNTTSGEFRPMVHGAATYETLKSTYPISGKGSRKRASPVEEDAALGETGGRSGPQRKRGKMQETITEEQVPAFSPLANSPDVESGGAGLFDGETHVHIVNVACPHLNCPPTISNHSAGGKKPKTKGENKPYVCSYVNPLSGEICQKAFRRRGCRERHGAAHSGKEAKDVSESRLSIAIARRLLWETSRLIEESDWKLLYLKERTDALIGFSPSLAAGGESSGATVFIAKVKSGQISAKEGASRVYVDSEEGIARASQEFDLVSLRQQGALVKSIMLERWSIPSGPTTPEIAAASYPLEELDLSGYPLFKRLAMKRATTFERYFCPEQGCDVDFTRLDALQRHVDNCHSGEGGKRRKAKKTKVDRKVGTTKGVGRKMKGKRKRDDDDIEEDGGWDSPDNGGYEDASDESDDGDPPRKVKRR